MEELSRKTLTWGLSLPRCVTKYSDLKCINSSKDEYNATHIYFKKDNYTFQWELQVWNKVDEANNINSHERYKQDYVKWENENKERRAK